MLTIIYTTIDDLASGERLAHQAIAEKIAACVNIIPNITSIYMWDNKIEQTAEYILLFKTLDCNKNSLIAWIEKHHPYETPAIIGFSGDASANFLQFVTNNLNIQN